uniref:Uncharacterized protein n=1 Tax=viral metagenome TaxID=1070528 RepID=A0A6C0D7L2_9ZZZZ
MDCVCRDSIAFPDLPDLHIEKNDYTDTTAELEQLLMDRYLLKRKVVEGVDERMLNDTQPELLKQITMNARKYALLKILENPTISESQKIEHITQHEKNSDSQNSKYMSEIFKGILFSEW